MKASVSSASARVKRPNPGPLLPRRRNGWLHHAVAVTRKKPPSATARRSRLPPARRRKAVAPKAMTNRPKKEKGRAKFPLAAYSNITTNAASPNTSLAAASGRTSRVGTEVFSTRPRGGSGGRLGFRWAQRRHRRPLHRRGGLVDLLGSDRRSSDARGLEGGEAADGPYPFEDLHRVRLPLLLDDLR